MKSNKNIEGNVEDEERRLIFNDFLACRMKVFVERMDNSLSKTHKQYNISRPQWMVMALLAQFPKGVASTEVKRSTAMDKSRINRTMNSLTDKQLILKAQNSDDNRAYNVRLNSKGKNAFTKIEESALHWGDELLAGISLKELKSLENVLSKLEDNLAKIESSQRK